jgi:single-stranded DNA-binding protein
MNIAIFTGRIGQKNLHETPSGDVIVFSVAINDNYLKDGNWVEKTAWVRVVKWNPSETIKGLEKGDEVLVEAKIEENEHKKEDGTKTKYINFMARSIKRIASARIPDKKSDEEYKAKDIPEMPTDDLPF